MQIAALLNPSSPPCASVLGTLHFSGQGHTGAGGSPCLSVFMRRLDDGEWHSEVWRGHGALSHGCHEDVRYCHDGDVVFGVVAMPESRFQLREGKTPLQQATACVYRNVFSLLDELGYRHIYRFWNYFSDINQTSHGLERYRQFNLGRQEAFDARGQGEAHGFPAACALGAARGPLSLAFLAGHAVPQCIENPRQVSAYQYPQQYSPRSPLFSRATRVSLRHENVLFISGTASVVGHATLHAGDVAGQARETVANLQAVLDEANRFSRHAPFALGELSCRVYVRNLADFPLVHAELTKCTGGALNAAYLQADICREDLLLEIDGVGTHALAPLPGSGAEG